MTARHSEAAAAMLLTRRADRNAGAALSEKSHSDYSEISSNFF